LFRRSRSPIFIVGDGVYREKMHRSFRQLIDRLGIPAVSTYAGKNAFFDEDDYYLLAVSKYWDVFAPGLLREVFKKNDLIALIGFDMAEGLRQSVWDFGISKKICAINSICENKKESLRMDLRVKAPYPEVFKALLGLGRKFMTRKEARAKKKQFSGLRRDLMKAGADFTAFDVVATLDKELSGDDILISDVGLHKQYAALFYRLKMPGTFFCSNGLASMGFGLPAAISAKKTYPRRRVVALCGDAGFHSVSHELETSIRCRLPVVCLVINDSGVGLIKHYQRKGFKVSDDNTTSFGRVDFVSLAQANGCDGFCVSSKKQLQKKLKKALESDKTVLVEVLLDKKKYSG
jgi:N2-(2-carboxyethyl)arginine synthase